MLKQVIASGAAANDGTGDTLRSAGEKIVANFDQLFSTYTVITTTTDVTATNDNGTFIVDTASNAVTIILPTAVANHGKTFIVKKTAAANTVTLDANAAETIDGASTKVLSAQWESVTITSDGVNWFII